MDEQVDRQGHIAGIDGLRAIAVLAVILFHMDASSFIKGGFTGVDLFFVISGYVIAKSLAGSREPSLRRFIMEFYKRRLLRILPGLLAMLVAATATSVLFIPPSWLSSSIDGAGMSAFFGFSNFRIAFEEGSYFSPKSDLNPFLHTWSLGLEEQFYLLFPALAYFGLNKSHGGDSSEGASRAGAAARLCLVALALASLAVSVAGSGKGAKAAYYLLPSRFWELATGAFLFHAHSLGRLLPQRGPWSSVLLLAGFGAALAGFAFAEPDAFPFPWALLPVSGAVLMICGIIGSEGAPSAMRKALESPLASYVGRLSYSLYLWHWPVSALLRWTIGFDSALSKSVYILASFILAAASYYLVEAPIRRSSILKRLSGPRVIAASLTLVALASLAARWGWDSRALLSLSRTRDAYLWQSGYYEADGPEKPVTEDPSVRGRRLFALGDSHVAAYRTMLDIVSKELGIEVREYEEGDCPVAGLLKPMDGRTRAHYESALREIRALARPGDVIFLASLRMPSFADQFAALDVDRVAEDYLGEAATRDRKHALAEAREVVDRLEETGAYVVMEAPLPVLLAPPYRCSDWFNKMNPVGANGLTVSRSLLERIRRPAMESIAALARGRVGFRVWDPFPGLCASEVFSAYDGKGDPIFWDGDHLSGNGNRMLAPSFRSFLLSLWRE